MQLLLLFSPHIELDERNAETPATPTKVLQSGCILDILPTFKRNLQTVWQHEGCWAELGTAHLLCENRVIGDYRGSQVGL